MPSLLVYQEPTTQLLSISRNQITNSNMRVPKKTTSLNRTRAYRARQSAKNKQQINAKQCQYDSLKRNNESPQRRSERLAKDRERKRKLRNTQSILQTDRINSDRRDQRRRLQSESQRPYQHPATVDTSDELLSDESINKAKQEALKQLHRTQIRDTDEHIAYVCVICDCFILGTEPLKYLTDLRIEDHRERLSVDKYKDCNNMDTDIDTDLDPFSSLWKYYEIPKHKGMLLSPRASTIGTGTDKWSCCEGCYKAMTPARTIKPPPRMAIANGFAIGEIDIEGLDIHEDVNEVTRALLAPVRTHGYVMAFSGGAHKSIMGHYQFFELDQERVNGAMSHLKSVENRDHIYVMFSGRMTPSQRRRITSECTVNTDIYNKLAVWFIDKSDHPGFRDLCVPDQCPQPMLIGKEETTNNTDKAVNPSVEDKFEGGSYYFSTGQDPQPQSSVYGTNKEFTLAMLKDEKPTLLVYGGDYKKSTELRIEDLLPFAFPYGLGGPKSKRPTSVSFESCIQRYARLASKEFMRGDTILVLHHMYGRQLSFKSGVITCRSNEGGITLGEKFANVSVQQLQKILEKDESQADPETRKLIKGISTSCRVLGHTPEAAQHARRNGFAYQDFFGLNSVFATVTPCDECSFRVRLFADPGKKVSD